MESTPLSLRPFLPAWSSFTSSWQSLPGGRGSGWLSFSSPPSKLSSSDLSPQIHSHGPARGQVLRSHQEHRTPAASQVQDALVAPKPQPIEQFGPDHELAPKCGVDEESFEGGDEKDSQPEPRPAGNDCQDEVKDDQAGQKGRSEGGVDSIRTTPPRDHAPGHTVTPAAVEQRSR